MAIGRTTITPLPHKPDDLIQPAQPLPLYNFIALPNPPEDWEFLSYRYETVPEQRVAKLPVMAILVKHYFWGIHWEETHQMPKYVRKTQSMKDLTQVLWKLFYYMQDIHRPRNWGEIMSIDRDTGPRLLRYDLNPRPSCLSRWFSTQPNEHTVVLPAYVRPANAPLDLPDIILQQYLYSAESFNSPAVAQLAWQEPPSNAQLLSAFNYSPPPKIPSPPQYAALPELPLVDRHDLLVQHSIMNYLQNFEQNPFHPTEQYDPGPGPSPKRQKRDLSPAAPQYRDPADVVVPKQALKDPVYAARRTTLEWNWVPPLEPEHFAPPVGEPQLGPIVPTSEPVYQSRVVAEAVEKALMQVVYSELDRDPTIPSRYHPTKSLTAHCFSDMLNMQIGTFNTTANVRLSPLTFEWDPTGAVFPLRGRGPVWEANSCATDCVLVAGMLLDAGCTKVDRANNRIAEFTENERSFIEAMNAPWDTFDDNLSKRVRDEFLRKFTDSQLHIRMGEPVPPWVVWSQVTKSFAQFRYHHVERVTPCPCEQAKPFINSHQGSCVLPGYRTGDDRGVSVATLIERCFYARKSFQCKRCGDPLGVTGERKIGQLPLRLVMTFDLKTRLKNHTKNLKFRYIDYEDKKQVAHYRWIGGVYNNEQHARVYWTDKKRGERGGDDIMMYDSQLNGGILFGGLPAFKPEDRVPLEWVHHSSIPLLFFERVLDPSRDLLASAHNAVYDLGNILGRNKNVLEEHVPWSPSIPRQQHEPWDRVLSTVGHRFADFNPCWNFDLSDPSSLSPFTFSPPMVDPTLVDPGVIDRSLIDPSMYSNTVPPIFDINLLAEPTLESQGNANHATQKSVQQRPEDKFKNHMFTSMLDSPDWLARDPGLWPSGLPSQEGALEFPDLPTWPSPKGRRNRTTMSDVPMPDAPPGGRSPDQTGRYKAAVMVNQTVSPRQRQAHASRLERQELDEYLQGVERRWWENKNKSELQQHGAREHETEEERQRRKDREYEDKRLKKKEEERRKAERDAERRLAMMKAAENLQKAAQPSSVFPSESLAPSPVTPVTPALPSTVDRTIKVRHKGPHESDDSDSKRKPSTTEQKRRDAYDKYKWLEEEDNRRVNEEEDAKRRAREREKEKREEKARADAIKLHDAEVLRQAKIDKHQSSRNALTGKAASAETMRRRHAEEKLAEEKRKQKTTVTRREDDPAWIPGDESESDDDMDIEVVLDEALLDG